VEKLTSFDEIIRINLQKLVDICGHELPTNLQNVSKNIPKSFRGDTFLKHPVHACFDTIRDTQNTVLNVYNLQCFFSFWGFTSRPPSRALLLDPAGGSPPKLDPLCPKTQCHP